MAKNFSARSKVVAVVGASGLVGRHVTEQLLLSRDFTIVLLFRKPNDELLKDLHELTSASGHNEQLKSAVLHDMTSIDELKQTFAKFNIDTVISACFSFDGSHEAVEMALLKASAESDTVHRFAPGNFATPIEWKIDFYKSRVVIAKESEKYADSISTTQFVPGIFMNYLGSNAPPKVDESFPGKKPLRPANGHLRPLAFIFNPSEKTADFVGTGDEPYTVTSIQDVGKYVAAACLIDRKWTLETGKVFGQVTTCNKVLEAFEKVNPPMKFTVTRTSIEEATERLNNTTDVFPKFLLQACIRLAEGTEWENGLKNDINFKPTTVEEFVKEWWDERK